MAAKKEIPYPNGEGSGNGKLGSFLVLYQELCVLLACIWGAFCRARDCSKETYDDLHIALAWQFRRVKDKLREIEKQC